MVEKKKMGTSIPLKLGSASERTQSYGGGRKWKGV